MNTFGKIKTKLEEASSKLYGKESFKTFMQNFKKIVLENKDISEMYYIYDDLSEKKGLPKDIAEDYVNESIEYCQILIESNQKTLNKIDEWVTKITGDIESNYKDIDNTIYLNSIKDLETVLESKTNIKKTIISENKKEVVVKESINLPINTMVGIANKTINKQISTLSEEDKKEIKNLVSLSKEEIKKEINSLKEEISSKLKFTLNESNDIELKNKVEVTIKKINDSGYDYHNLYKLRKLNLGL